ncbi:4-hydroxy-3-polyprenylbenzoate decarboxylase [Thermanaeromonas toyohensis ToBE]|uniref:Flavin prenyltransferase UbiX n=1 Tax=Thermanaeromonas toyohensis ToBE TaxID=698762 RepID=A0A1W1W3P6_9FIRM|nr:UbiX family flavin prenyltransferase [Thermanaeromonas toyohensis]SMC00080.1 4-hydroxy-3-polyprenylbenzoate decarboxylase [Thermanaeromonas toyohensis ToBE]
MRLIVAMTGATGAIYGIRLLEVLKEKGLETHLILSRWAEETIKMETSWTVEAVRKLAAAFYCEDDLGAALASGSFRHQGMIIVPCSMKTLASIAHGLAINLISRAADVTLKEGRKLILVPRETPLNAIHLENMLRLARLGAVILPPMPAFYHHPRSLQDLVDHLIGRILDQLDIEHGLYQRWPGAALAREEKS